MMKSFGYIAIVLLFTIPSVAVGEEFPPFAHIKISSITAAAIHYAKNSDGSFEERSDQITITDKRGLLDGLRVILGDSSTYQKSMVIGGISWDFDVSLSGSEMQRYHVRIGFRTRCIEISGKVFPLSEEGLLKLKGLYFDSIVVTELGIPVEITHEDK